MSRRAVLAGGLGAGASLLVACQGGSSGTAAAGGQDRDAPLRAAATTDELALLAQYDATLAAHPELAPLLAPVRSQHAEHQRALGVTSRPTRTPAGTVSPSAPVAPVLPSMPADRGAALQALATAESAAAARRATGAVAASRQLAPVLGSVAASESSHAVVLTMATAAAPAPTVSPR